MAESFKFELSGDKELIRALEELPKRVKNKVMRKAVNRSLRPFRSRARANCPRRFGYLQKSLDVTTRTYPSGVIVGLMGPRTADRHIIVNPRTGKREVVYPAKYAHLVDGGTAPHALGKGDQRLIKRVIGETEYAYTLKKGKKAGQVRFRKRKVYKAEPGLQKGPVMHPGAKAQGFMRKAWHSEAAAAEQILLDDIRAGVYDETGQLYRGGGA